eukprot:scaffold18164_cov62-Attheya_sp.AAC.2
MTDEASTVADQWETVRIGTSNTGNSNNIDGCDDDELIGSPNQETIVKELSVILERRFLDIVLSRGEPASSFSPALRKDLQVYVSEIGDTYHDTNKYHRFEHAAHVMLSANSLLDMLDEQDSTRRQESLHYLEAAIRHADVHSSVHSSSSAGDQSYQSYQSRETKANAQDSSEPINGPSLSSSPPAGQHQLEEEELSFCSLFPEQQARSSTFGIATDALTKFALVFAALIHDADHQGVPNATLVEEECELAQIYSDRSIAEQNSLRVGFTILLHERFSALRELMTPTWEDKTKFRRTVIDLVLCTDIADPDQMQISKAKWNEAFCHYVQDKKGTIHKLMGRPRRCNQHKLTVFTGSAPLSVNVKKLRRSRSMYNSSHSYRMDMDEDNGPHLNGSYSPGLPASRHSSLMNEQSNLKREEDACFLEKNVALEVMMNAADVAHTMQSWDTFLKWNRMLFHELEDAHKDKRPGSWDPTADWFNNQIVFYDLYVLPLAHRLHRIGLFGRTKDNRFVNNANAIKRRWMLEGEAITKEMIASRLM